MIIIAPDSNIRVVFEFIFLLNLVTLIIEYPIQLCFESAIPPLTINIMNKTKFIIIPILLLESFLNFFTGYVHNCAVEYKFTKIFFHNLKYNTIYDIITILPLFYFYSFK